MSKIKHCPKCRNTVDINRTNRRGPQGSYIWDIHCPKCGQYDLADSDISALKVAGKLP